MALLYIALAALVGAALLARVLSIGRRPTGCPPGPPTIPLLGNIHQMPTRDAHRQFEKWARDYGPIYSLILGTKILIVLSSDEAVKELLDRRGAIYSDRMDMYIGQTLCSGGERMLMMRYDYDWYKYWRKMCHALLNITVSKTYVPYQSLESQQMMYDLLEQPDGFLKHVRRYANSLTTTMVYGWRSPSYEDPDVQQLFDGFMSFVEINQTGTSALLDSFPILRNLPDFMLPAQKTAKALHERERLLYLKHWHKAKSAFEADQLKPSFCKGMAESQPRDGFSDHQAAYMAGTLLEAGSDTTSSTLYGFIQAMLLYPSVQVKAHAEIDAVVGRDRLPTMDDEADLPYIRACVKEVVRWLPVAITGAVPHAVVRDDEYLGYKIPAGAGVMNNAWAITRDPNKFPNPDRFEPERYLGSKLSLHDLAISPETKDRDAFGFGAGRRLCQGMHVAERSLFLAISRMMWGFEITPYEDEMGKPILPNQEELTQGFVVMPVEYRARIEARSEKKAELIRGEWEWAQKECLHPTSKQWLKHIGEIM